jgi:outer membrane protein OmpA-like peptidoglycan-associated protein
MADKDLVTKSQLRSAAERVVSSMDDLVDDSEFDAATTQLRSEHQSILDKLDSVLEKVTITRAEEASF